MATRMWFDVDRVVKLVEMAHHPELIELGSGLWAGALSDAPQATHVKCRCGKIFDGENAKDLFLSHRADVLAAAKQGKI